MAFSLFSSQIQDLSTAARFFQNSTPLSSNGIFEIYDTNFCERQSMTVKLFIPRGKGIIYVLHYCTVM